MHRTKVKLALIELYWI